MSTLGGIRDARREDDVRRLLAAMLRTASQSSGECGDEFTNRDQYQDDDDDDDDDDGFYSDLGDDESADAAAMTRDDDQEFEERGHSAGHSAGPWYARLFGLCLR